MKAGWTYARIAVYVLRDCRFRCVSNSHVCERNYGFPVFVCERAGSPRCFHDHLKPQLGREVFGETLRGVVGVVGRTGDTRMQLREDDPVGRYCQKPSARKVGQRKRRLNVSRE